MEVNVIFKLKVIADVNSQFAEIPPTNNTIDSNDITEILFENVKYINFNCSISILNCITGARTPRFDPTAYIKDQERKKKEQQMKK